ncbi:MAG TPA: hypothetical protein VJ726_00200 [Candidatus Limnocylindria bacterium]|nr:hypothetical protein [Candidatus Limnocylindria bacterium]
MRVLIAVVLLLSACAPVAQPAASDAPASPVAEPSAGQTLAPTPSPTPTAQPGPALKDPVVTIASAPFPIAPTFTLTRSAVAPTDEGSARWGIERYLEGLDRYREHGDYLPARGAFGQAVAAALVESRTPGVKRKFVLESLRIESIYKKPWGTQALADVRVTIVDRAVDGSAPDQRETGLLRLAGDKLQVVDSWDAVAGRWFNGRVPDDAAGLRESVAQAIGLYLRKESWVVGGPVETYADGFGMTPFKTARNAYVAAFDRARTTSRTFEDVTGAIERHDTFAELPGGITTARLSATVVTTDAAGRTLRESVTRRVKVFFGNWMPEVVDEEVTPGVWRSGGDLALVEIDVNLA